MYPFAKPYFHVQHMLQILIFQHTEGKVEQLARQLMRFVLEFKLGALFVLDFYLGNAEISASLQDYIVGQVLLHVVSKKRIPQGENQR